MIFSEFISKAIEIPFVEKGRSWDGVDCWGLIFLAFKEVHGVDLPEYTGEYKSTRQLRELQNLISKKSGDSWTQVKDPQKMDCILLSVSGTAAHIGLFIDSNGNFLHIERNRNAYIDNINNLMWQGPGYSNIRGYYRYGVKQKS